MADLYLSDLNSDISGYKLAFVNTRNPKTTAKATSTTNAPTAAAAGTTTGVTATAGGTALKWITKPLSVAVTFAGSTNVNAWLQATSTGGIIGASVDINQFSGITETAAPFQLDVVRSPAIPTAAEGQMMWIPTKPTSTSFAVGDRVVVHVNLVTLASTAPNTGTVAFTYDGPTEGASGDSFVTNCEAIRVGSVQSAGTNLSAGESRGLFQETINKLGQYNDIGLTNGNMTVRAVIDQLTTESQRN